MANKRRKYPPPDTFCHLCGTIRTLIQRATDAVFECLHCDRECKDLDCSYCDRNPMSKLEKIKKEEENE